MSLIECQDGRYYNLPQWNGVYGPSLLRWVLREDQLYVEVLKKTAYGFKSLIHKAMNEIGFSGRITLKEAVYTELAAFPPDWRRAKAYQFEYTFLGPPPVPPDTDGIMDNPDFGDLKFCWNVAFPTISVWAFFTEEKKKLDIQLANFLIGEPLFNQEAVFNMKERIRRILPNLTGLTLEEARDQYGDHIRISRTRNRVRTKQKQ